jgi:hypothetical protein
MKGNSLHCFIAAVFVISLAGSTTALSSEGLVFAMNFDEGSGDKVNDLSGNGNHGMVEGSTDWTAGKYGGGFHLDGSTHITVPNADPLSSLTHPMSVGCWVNPDELGGWRNIVEMDAEGAGGWKMGFHDSRAIVWTTYRVQDFISETPINPGTWTHVAATWDGSQAIVYVNGEPDPPIAGGGVIDTKDLPSLDIGYRRTSAASFYVGVIDDLFIHNKVLSQQEINDLMGGLSVLSVEPDGKAAITWGALKL